MNPDPFSDTIAFLLQPGWTTAIFWLLLIASIAIAIYVFRTIPSQRRIEHVGNWAFRLLIGCMWSQQSLWKLPPYYTDQPQEPFGTTGLAYWIGLMGKHAAIPLQADFVNNIVPPHFYLFAPIVYGLEVLTAVSLILGCCVRLGASSHIPPRAVGLVWRNSHWAGADGGRLHRGRSSRHPVGASARRLDASTALNFTPERTPWGGDRLRSVAGWPAVEIWDSLRELLLHPSELTIRHFQSISPSAPSSRHSVERSDQRSPEPCEGNAKLGEPRGRKPCYTRTPRAATKGLSDGHAEQFL